MATPMHLETSFTFVTPKTMKDTEKPHISEETFGSDEHTTIDDDGLAEALRSLAMQEMATAKVPVKTNSHAEKVEFFWLDVKKDKKTVQKLNKLLAAHWVQLLWHFEKARDECDSNMLSAGLNEAAADIEEFIKLRRFLRDGTDSDNLKKGKRSVLLFHHSDANAPAPE